MVLILKMDSSRQNSLFPQARPSKKKRDITQEMIDIWKNEKFAKELLPCQDKFISELTTYIEEKEKDLAGVTKEIKDIAELDLERLKFVIKDYLRIRLFKIQKYLFYILKEDLSSILTPNEIKFIVELINMKSVYFNEGLKKVNILCNNFRPFLDKFKNMSDKITSLNDEMIIKPNTNDYVFVESIVDQNIIVNFKEKFENCEQEYLVMEKGFIYFLPYSLIKEDLIKKKVKLI